MLHRRLHAPAGVALDFEAIRTELGIPADFPPAAVREAASARPELSGYADATDLPLVTIDPPGSRDLDQAVALEARPGGGWIVHYAIADVAAWVAPGGDLDAETRRRTQTYYAPDRRRPLHPEALGEAAASLLPDGPRPAALWRIEVGPDGEPGEASVRRALVRSRAQLSYPQVQADLDARRAPAPVAEFPALGEALLGASQRRGAIELGLPEQDVVPAPSGGWTVALRADLPIEQWNAQVSLLTGRAAASLMLGAGVGLLRTVPTPDPAAVERLRGAAANLGIAWPATAGAGAVLGTLDIENPRHAAFADLAAELLRGAGYTAFAGSPPADPGHAGVGAPYAHVTAPLRRLADRFATEVCLAIAAGVDVPAWAAEALAGLPEVMAEGDHRGHALERAIVDAAEAFVLADRVGQVFAADVVETGDRFGTVVLEDPPVRARCDTRRLPLGQTVHVRCTEADVATRTVRFERVS